MSWTTIDFEGPPVNIPVGVRYSNNGFIFPQKSQIITLPLRGMQYVAHSGVKALVSRDLTEEFDDAPLIIQFTCNVRAVRLYTGLPNIRRRTGHNVYISLEAFDVNDKLVARQSKTVVGPTDVNIEMMVKDPANHYTIKYIRLDARYGPGRGLFEFIDDIGILTEGPPPILATEPPIVNITSPTAPATNTGDITISGNIVGKGILPEAAPPELEISWPTDPSIPSLSSKKYSLILNKNLFWTQPNQVLNFSIKVQLDYFGKNTITVKAWNAMGEGSDQTSITYLPQAIEKEYQKQKSEGTFGKLKWGSSDGCVLAIYEKGAIHHTPPNTYSVLGKIFKKWKPLYLGKVLGCAISEEKSVLGVPGATSQDFVGGRIYSGPKDEYYVIEPFLDAIDKLNFVSKYGLPVTDPVSQNLLMLPLLWQKFETTIGGQSFISSMEVTDNPLTLWVAFPDFEGAKKAGVKTFTSRIPTVWRSFKMKKLGEPAVNVVKPVSTIKFPYSVLEKACNYSHYPIHWKGNLPVLGKTPQWAPLLPTKKIIPFIGTIEKRNIASEDAPWNHECSICRGIDYFSVFGIKTQCMKGVDMCIKAIPDPGFEHILEKKQSYLEIEYEYCIVGYPPQEKDLDKDKEKDILRVGDKLFVAGRWISDCGCHPWYSCSGAYKSEIHPPAVMINMYTQLKSGQPATIGDIVYLDWWYPGESVEMDIFPPPRPKPNYKLSVEIPVWPKMCPSDGGKAGIKYSIEPKTSHNHLHLKISGRPDVKFNTPPKENMKNGQLYHGTALGAAGLFGTKRPPVDPNYPHTKSLYGQCILRWKP